jgi:hypothetical protein
MSTTLDPGRKAPTVPPHPGDKAAQRIRAALERIRSSGQPQPAETPEVTR